MANGVRRKEEMEKRKNEEKEGGMMNAMKNRARKEEGLFVILRRFHQGKKTHTCTHPALLPPMHHGQCIGVRPHSMQATCHTMPCSHMLMLPVPATQPPSHSNRYKQDSPRPSCSAFAWCRRRGYLCSCYLCG